MTRSRGRLKYVPREVLDEIERVKRECRIVSDSEAMRYIANKSRFGRRRPKGESWGFKL
jgi:hypothetical protein